MITQEQVQASLNSGGTVTLPAGTYRFENLVIPKGSTLIGSITGQTTLEGSRVISEWKSSGDLRYAPYTQLPVTDGHGIAFSTGQNLANPYGKYADQAWTRTGPDDGRLKRVHKSNVVRGTFAVDGGSIWVHKDDAALGIIVSDKRVAIRSLEGTLSNVDVKRYSPTASDGAAIRMNGGSIYYCAIDSCSFVSVQVTGRDPSIEKTSITRAGWMGIAANQCTNLYVNETVFNKINDFGYFATAPQSGAMKTSRCRQVTVFGVAADNVVGNGLWFDQSTSDVTVCRSNIRASSSGVFFEISHGLTLVDSWIRSTTQDAVKIAGASGVVITRNELEGKRHAVGIYVDKRSIPGYSDPRNPITAEMKAAGVYSSDRRSLETRDARITWIPRVEVLERNTLKSDSTPVYVLTTNGKASVPKTSILPLGHQ